MKNILTTIAAVLMVGCGESQPPEPPDISISKAAYKGNIEAVKQHIAAGKQGERYLNQHKLSTGMVAIIAEGDFEPRSMGSYSIRIYGANSQFPADDFLSGTIRTRDGSVEKVIVQDIDRDGTEEVIVFIRNAGSGHYLSMDVFQYQFKKLKLITSVSGLEPNIDPVNELKRILKTAPDKD